MNLLHHEVILRPDTIATKKRMLLLHGIFGAGRNWRSAARRLVKERSDWAVVPVDLRSHGSSPRLPAPFTVESCSRDLLDLQAHLDFRADAVLGHSFGGKVALRYACQRPDHRIQVWVVDSAPGARQPGGSAWRMLGVLRGHPGPFRSRAEAIAAVRSAGFSGPVARWMATNVKEEGDQWQWRLNPDDMEELLRDFFRTDIWDFVEAPPPGTTIHFVKASKSRVMDGSTTARIREAARKTGQVHLHEIEGGHWVHTDNPGALQRLLADRL